MSRTLFPFHSDDISSLARSLKGQLAHCEPQPSHLEILNMLARANGYRNFQHYRAELAAGDQLGASDLIESRPLVPGLEPEAVASHSSAPGPKALENRLSVAEQEPLQISASESKLLDFARVKRLLRMFDPEGKLAHWPSKRSQQELCLWVIWSKLPARVVLTEKEVNQVLNHNHLFGDHPLLRRWLCDYGMLSRTRDGREYRRVEKRPPAEAIELMRRLRLE